MSTAGSFDRSTGSGERQRIAHRPRQATQSIIEQLAFKRKSVSKMVNLLASRSRSPKKENRAQPSSMVRAMKRGQKSKRTRQFRSSSSEQEEEETAIDEAGSNDDEGDDDDIRCIEDGNDFLRSNKPESSIVHDGSADSDSNISKEKASGSEETELKFEDRIKSISDIESDEKSVNDISVQWLCKPRLNKQSTLDQWCQLGNSKNKRKRAVILSSSDEESETEIRKAITLKSVVKKAKKSRNTKHSSSEDVSGSEYNSEDSNSSGSFQDDSINQNDSKDTISESESAPVNLKDENIRDFGSQRNLRRRCVQFFNEADRKLLMSVSRVTDKIADFVIDKRPFDNFADLQQKLSTCPRGASVVEQYIGVLENTSILESILEDCRQNSEEMHSALERVKLKQLQAKPKLLSDDFDLHPYQQIGLNWLFMMHKLKLNAILADEMGLGKTIQVIAFISYLKGEGIKGPHLIVVPSSTIENWLSEFSKWSPSINILTYYGSMDDRRQLRNMATDKNVDVLLTTYNMIGSKIEDRKFFKRFKINYVVYDEGHLLKNCSTDRYKNLMKVRGERKILLTGTPMQNNLIELISLMYFTMTKLFTKYCDDIGQLLQQFQQKIPAMDAKNGSLYEADKIEKAKLILKPYILRRLKCDVLSCLPKKSEEVILCEMTPEQKDIYVNLVEEFRNMDCNGEKNFSSRLMQLRQIANHPLLYRRKYTDDRVIKVAQVLCSKEAEYSKKKSEHVAEDLAFLSDFAISQLCSKYTSVQKYCLNEKIALKSGKFTQLDKLLPLIKDKGDKVLIFSQFTTMMDILEVYLRLRGHKYCRLDGSTPVMERQELINQYNSSPDLFIFLLSTKAGGLGINLTAANHIILHDIDFNPYNDKQAEGRCHRMGQKKHVHVVRLISCGSVEEQMLALAEKKLELEKEITGGEQDGMSERRAVEILLKKALAL